MTLRSRLALWYAVGGTTLVALFATTLYAFVAVRLARPLDHQLRQDLAELERSLLATAGDSLRWQGSEIARGPVEVTEHPWFELWDERGGLVLRRWPFTENRNLILPPPNRLAAPGSGKGTVNVRRRRSGATANTLIVPGAARRFGGGRIRLRFSVKGQR
ncbi:MAG: hypothetical protein ACKOUK_08170, partial [Verrucomicrobiota bacterium]